MKNISTPIEKIPQENADALRFLKTTKDKAGGCFFDQNSVGIPVGFFQDFPIGIVEKFK